MVYAGKCGQNLWYLVGDLRVACHLRYWAMVLANGSRLYLHSVRISQSNSILLSLYRGSNSIVILYTIGSPVMESEIEASRRHGWTGTHV